MIRQDVLEKSLRSHGKPNRKVGADLVTDKLKLRSLQNPLALQRRCCSCVARGSNSGVNRCDILNQHFLLSL